MGRTRYLIVILLYLVVILLFQFSCVKRISRFTPGDEFLYFLYLYAGGEYSKLVGETEILDLESLKTNQAKKIAYMTAVAALKIEDYESAEKYLEYCLKNYKVLEDYVLYNLSVVYSKKGNYKAALEMGEKLLEEYPDSVWYNYMTVTIGGYHAGLGDYDTALSIYEEFLKENKESEKYPKVLFLKGETLEMMGRNEDAKSIYKKVWINYPSDDISAEAFSGIVRLGGVDGLSVSELKKRVDTLYNLNRYSMVISAIGEMPALLKTRYESLTDYKDLEFIKAKSYYRTRKYTKSMEIFDRLSKNPGNLSKKDLLYWRANVYDRLDKDELAISTYLEIFGNYPKSSLADDALYLAARTCEEVKDYDRAIYYYKKYLDTFSHGKMVEEILWYTGWLYYKMGDYESAEGYFTRLAENYKGKDKYPQYLYWKARSLEKRDMIEDASSIYKTILEEYPATYYGYQVGERLRGLGFDVELTTKGYKFDPNFWTRGHFRYTEFTSDERIVSHLERSMELVAMDMDDDANRELELVVSRCVGDPDLLIEVARLLRYSGDYYTPIVIANRNFKPYLDQYVPGENDLYWQMKYPEGYKKEVERLSSEYGIEPTLIYSIIRAESLYQPGVYSWAGAIGLMQIIPDTGRGIAKDMGISDFEVDDLLDYKTNLTFGVYYLSGLLKKYDGEIVYALCGYNAGPGNARKWIDARDPDTDMDEFIENIPYPETRQYIKRILEYYSIYRALYEGENIIQ